MTARETGAHVDPAQHGPALHERPQLRALGIAAQHEDNGTGNQAHGHDEYGSNNQATHGREYSRGGR